MTATILVVDDEPLLAYIIQQRFRHQIRNKALAFDFAQNGAVALEKIQTSDCIDMVLTDIKMPEVDGLTLLDRIADIDPTLKAVVVSAYGDLENIRTAMNRGAFDFLTKPIDLEDLEITIAKTLAFVEQMRTKQRELDAAREQLRYLAFYDSLTGLPNQSLFLERMRQCIENQQQFAILAVEIERYRLVKSSLGRTTGELLLAEIARRLQGCVPPQTMVSRMETDEFAILLEEISDETMALETAERIHAELSAPFDLDGPVISSTANIGIVCSSIGSDLPEDYLQAADTAMHSATMQGIGATALFDSRMQSLAVKRLQLEADLAKAIAHKNLHLHYQPIVSLADDAIVGFEALVRWQHPERGAVSPSEFIPVAEQTGLIIPLGQWVLSEAIARLSLWSQNFPHLPSLSISVNVSGLQLFLPDLLSQLEAMLRSHSLDGDRLKLEITESILIENADVATAVIEQLRARQIQLCIDDFGTGYSSLSYLHRLPIDTLKIDRSFVHSMLSSERTLTLVRTIVNLAKSLGLGAIAEGVETIEQVRELRDLGCPHAQGYFFSEGLSPEAVEALLASQIDR